MKVSVVALKLLKINLTISGKEMHEMKMLENQMLLVNDVLRENRKKVTAKRQELEGKRSRFCDSIENKILQLSGWYTVTNDLFSFS
jgi:tRNA U34 5-carboxymethylaminomethyl modifying enzyme MnmG/GidA